MVAYPAHKLLRVDSSDHPTLSEQWYIGGLPAWVVARLITETLQASRWNIGKPNFGRFKNKTGLISFSAFEAFIQQQHVDTVEQKLRLLFRQHAEAASGSVSHLVRVYLSPTKQSLHLEAIEPISGNLTSVFEVKRILKSPDQQADIHLIGKETSLHSKTLGCKTIKWT